MGAHLVYFIFYIIVRVWVLIPIFTKKGDVRLCGNYRSIKLLEHGIKVIEKIFERNLWKVVKLDEMKMGFMPGRGTTDAIFIMRQLMKKYEMVGRNLYMVFVDLEKAFIVFQERCFGGR